MLVVKTVDSCEEWKAVRMEYDCRVWVISRVGDRMTLYDMAVVDLIYVPGGRRMSQRYP